ncbi:hypothetical protein [Kingella sp. (in: b-proteobacteria)]|uniref:hypothetical protein n=1 Tax=Kingella sp. (in: b-proteobacteria) TaxID=2020713 RepID=UPI0026DD2396|nr:hypothetical protein [Kingella sp. (in: b-proteobacteria)]MDO4657617.1 hypothetical protein [Kingella sp. (in: b-proteobacteria)]
MLRTRLRQSETLSNPTPNKPFSNQPSPSYFKFQAALKTATKLFVHPIAQQKILTKQPNIAIIRRFPRSANQRNFSLTQFLWS